MKKNLFLLMTVLTTHAALSQNILLVHNNKPVDYTKVTAPVIREAVTGVIKIADHQTESIIAAASAQTLANTLYAYDAMQYEISDVLSKLGLISATFSDDSIRSTAFAEMSRLQLYSNGIYLNEPLYKAIRKFYQSPAAKNFKPTENKFLSDLLIAFEKNGMKLDPAEREALKAINSKLIELSNAFDRNIAESKLSTTFTAGELQGLSDADMAPWKRDDGQYGVAVNYPNYVKIMENAVSGETRKKMYILYNNRAYPENLGTLDSLLAYRDQFAKKLGFRSYAAYAVVDKMAATPENVWAFENDLVSRLSPLVTEDIRALKETKRASGAADADQFNAWDYSYYTKKLTNTRYNLNTDEVKEYFEMNNTLRGMFGVYETLLGLEIRETTGVPVWDPKIKTFDMYKDGVKTGSFYLDLYPRPNKYTHFECNPISQYRNAAGTEVLPVAALICNFPEGTASQPSLLKHSDVTTLFHEFGHLVHWLVCHPAISSQNAFGTKGDFVEAPSQFLENWCWEYDALKTFAKHYKTGQVLPESLFSKMKAAQMLNSGSYNIRQVSLGLIDFTFEDKYSETKEKGIMGVAMEKFSLMQLPYPEGSHSICSFTHLSGYAANYYGYLWSKVYAQDMFSVFKKNGVMDRTTGVRYRKEILEKGSSENEADIVEHFLGRKSNSEAFLQSLGVRKL